MRTSPENPETPPGDLHHAQRGLVVWLRNKFLAGLALALPLAVTFLIIQFAYGLLHGWSYPILKWFVDLANEMSGRVVIGTDHPNFILATRFIGVLIPLLALVALGVMATNVIGRHIVTAVDRLLLRVPLVSFIYKSLKQVIDSFKTVGGAQNFKRVAYIDYPAPGMRLLGFVTGGFTDPSTGKAFTTVFVPTVPNPMSGILLVVDAEKVTDAPISLEDSMKLVFSAGLVGPQTLLPPLNQRPVAPIPNPEIIMQEPEDEIDLSPEPPEDPALVSLPRAEDFDSGDPDILADADQLIGGTTRKSSRLARVLPWKRR